MLRITATRDERNTAKANTAYRSVRQSYASIAYKLSISRRRYDEDDEDGPPAKRSKWKHFKPAEPPAMMTGVRIGPPPGLLS